MADTPHKPCEWPGCANLVKRARRCGAHRRATLAQIEALRPTAHERGYTREWQRAREAWLRQHPFCVHCMRLGRTVPATEVDHIKPHRGNAVLFWDRANWQSLCKPCHSSKTMSELRAGLLATPYPQQPQAALLRPFISHAQAHDATPSDEGIAPATCTRSQLGSGSG